MPAPNPLPDPMSAPDLAHTIVPDPAPNPASGPVSELAATFRLLGDPSRLAILLACLAEPRPVGELAARLGLAPSLVSHHLRLLRTARLLSATRHGKQVIHAAADHHIAQMLTAMLEHQQEDATTHAA